MSLRLMITSFAHIVGMVAADDHVHLMQATKFATASADKSISVEFDGEVEMDEELSDCDKCVARCKSEKSWGNDVYCLRLCEIKGKCFDECTYATERPPSLAPEEQTSHGPEKGSLVICGGACGSRWFFDETLKRARAAADDGIAHLAWIPTNWDIYVDYTNQTLLNAAFEDFKELSGWGDEDLIIVHAYTKEEADTDEFANKLKDRNGIWMKGGRQWRGMDVYGDTKTEIEIKNVLARGGVFGGTSAGASIQGDFMARGDTATNQYVVGDHLWGLGFVHNVAIDQHNTQRRRNGGLLDWIELHPEYLGISLDENTAIVVEGDEFEVIGENYVEITDATLWQSENYCSNYSMVEGMGRPLLPHQERYFFLKAASTIGTRFQQGDRYNIRTREVLCCAKR